MLGSVSLSNSLSRLVLDFLVANHGLRWYFSRKQTCLKAFTGPDALDPCVIKLADIPAVLEPSTAASTTTDFAGFLECAALGALVHIVQGCSCRGGCFCKRTCGRCKVTRGTTDTGNDTVTIQYAFK